MLQTVYFLSSGAFLRFLLACLHWREGDRAREVGGGAGVPQRVYGKQHGSARLHLNHLSMHSPPNYVIGKILTKQIFSFKKYQRETFSGREALKHKYNILTSRTSVSFYTELVVY